MRRLLHDRAGSLAVEFALLAIPLCLTIFAVIENGLVYFAASDLDGAVDRAARIVRTGQLQQPGLPAAAMQEQFRDELCGELSGLLRCGGRLTIDMRVFDRFSSVDFSAVDPDSAAFDPGGPDEIVLIRAFYRWPLLTPAGVFAADKDGNRLLTSAAVFRNEPFGGGGGGGGGA